MLITKLGGVLQRQMNSVEVAEDKVYPLLGVRSFGKGAFEAGDLLGSETSYLRLLPCTEGQVVYPKLMAWEGAFDIVSPTLSGRFVSPEFCLFDVDESRAIPSFIGEFLRSERFMSQVRSGATGTNVRRRRLQPSQFEAIQVPLPTIDDQKRILDRIYEVSELRRCVRQRAAERRGLGISLLHHLIDRSAAPVKLGELLKQRTEWVSVEDGHSYATLGMSKAGRGAFVKQGDFTKASRLQRLIPGDFVYSRLFAWQGSFGLVPTSAACVYASNEFPTFEVDVTSIMPQYLAAWFRQPAVWHEVEKLCTGSTPGSRNRFKESRLLSMEICLPDMNRQEEAVRILGQASEVESCSLHQEELSDALLKSIRDDVFANLD